MKAYFGQEARDYQSINPKGFKKSFDTYKKTLRNRIKTFEKHGKGESASAKRLREALYDATHARSNNDKAMAFSRMSFALTSARGSYSRSREIDRKIVASLNEELSQRDPETGEIIKPFIKLSELEDFGEMMEDAKNMSWADLYGSSQIAKGIRQVIDDNKGKRPLDWRTKVKEYLESKENDKKGSKKGDKK